MALKEQIDSDIKVAMKSGDKDGLRALRAIKSLILLAETSEGANGVLSLDTELKLLTRAAKQRRESADIFTGQGRADLAQTELQELAIIERYLPKQLSNEELAQKLNDIITKVGATGPGDIGKVMGIATKELAGLADGKAISATAKALLA